MPILYLFAFVPIIITVLVVHEYGHLITARLFRVKTLEFGIGFPPRLFAFATGNTPVAVNRSTAFYIDGELQHEPPRQFQSGAIASVVSHETADGTLTAIAINIRTRRKSVKPPHIDPYDEPNPILQHRGRIRSVSPHGFRIADMEWSFNAIPVGAFVHLHDDVTKRSRLALNTKPPHQQTIVLFAGILANLLFPIVPIAIATVLLSGATYIQVAEVIDDSPASRADIRPGDVILAIDDVHTRHTSQLPELISRNDTITITVQTPSETPRQVIVTTEALPDSTRIIGVVLATRSGSIPTVGNLRKTPVRTVSNTAIFYTTFYSEITSWISGNAKPELSGLIGIAQQTATVVEQSKLVGFLTVTAILSLNIGIVNLIPIVPLDGGRLAILAFQAIRPGPPISRSAETKITAAGLVVIGLIVVWLAVVDIARLI